MIEMSGALCLYKESGMTSHDAVNKIRRLYGTKRVGHTGTLDPMATGVLVVLVGRAAKAAEFLGGQTKEYTATLRLGLATDTQDITGTVLHTYEGPLPSLCDVQQTAKSFLGRTAQLPPMYSAIKIGGKKLIDLARKSITVERQPRMIEITSIDVRPGDDPAEFILRVVCGAGTYIRTLCADIGDALGCGGVMKTLERTASGRFRLEDAFTLSELSKMEPDRRQAVLMPTEELFTGCPCIHLPEFFEHLAHSGAQIYQAKIGTDFPENARVLLYGKDGFFALGEVRSYPEGSAIKPIRQFVLQ